MRKRIWVLHKAPQHGIKIAHVDQMEKMYEAVHRYVFRKELSIPTFYELCHHDSIVCDRVFREYLFRT